jgi:hypothetical protein
MAATRTALTGVKVPPGANQDVASLLSKFNEPVPAATPRGENEMTFTAPVMSYGPNGEVYTNLAQRQEAVKQGLGVDTLPQTPKWSLEGDPLYQQALAGGQAQFNYARNAALADKMTAEQGLGQQRKSLDRGATESRRRLAGNYAARGMAGGAAGALSQAEARANAEQVAARTSIADQITALNNQFLQNYGDVTSKNYDWTGTLVGQQYKTQAAQQALEAALARYGTV